MRTNTVIKIDNLGKRYLIGEKERYLAFRDSLANFAKQPYHLLKGKKPPKQKHIWALKDLSFRVNQGEVVGIIGRNGAGKTTLLKILSRITEPTTGQVIMRGRVSSLLEVGTGFHPELTGRENIYLSGAILGMTRKEIRYKFNEIVEFSGIEPFLDTPLKRYSSGMGVRLAFAVAAHLDSEILLVDEVLAVGDIEFQKKCLGKMRDITSSGKTILFVSHNMGQINKLCNRVILLEKGELLKDGSPGEVVSNYLNHTSKSFSPKDSGKILASRDGSVILKSVNIRPKTGLGQLNTGEACKIELEFIFYTKINNPAPIVSLRTSEGLELMRFSTYPISGIDTGTQQGEVKFTLEIGRLQLSGGTYILAVGLALPKIQYLIDVTEVGKFEVMPLDYYGSGLFIDNRLGCMVAEHKWGWKKIT